MAGMLLEREAERSALASAVERAAAGDHGGLMMVLGEAGIGKTALLAVVRDLARAASIRTFRAAGAPLERDFGYGVVRQLLEGELRSRSAGERSRLLSGASAPAIPCRWPRTGTVSWARRASPPSPCRCRPVRPSGR